MIQHACGDAHFFDHAVAIEQRGNPNTRSSSSGLRTMGRPPAGGVGGVVGNGVVEHFARTLGFRVDVVKLRASIGSSAGIT